MKPEPLIKYVIREVCTCQHPDCEADGKEAKFYREDWVKSAVEWLKHHLFEMDAVLFREVTDKRNCEAYINQAFEDVIKKH